MFPTNKLTSLSAVHIRVSRKGLGKGKFKNLSTASNEMQNLGARSREGDNLQKHNIHLSDGAKYMSCLKVNFSVSLLIYEPLRGRFGNLRWFITSIISFGAD